MAGAKGSPKSGTSRPNNNAVRVLVAVNAALVLVLGAVTLSPDATAQANQARPAGKYMLVGGQPISGNSNVAYVIDTVNAEMVAVKWNQGRRLLEGVGFRDFDADRTATPQR